MNSRRMGSGVSGIGDSSGQHRPIRRSGIGVSVNGCIDIVHSETVSEVNTDNLIGIGSHLKFCLRCDGLIENMGAAIGGILADSGNFSTELGYLLLNSIPVGGGITAVGGLESEGSDTLVHGGHFVHGTFRSLGIGNAVLGVAVSLIKAVDLGGQTV